MTEQTPSAEALPSDIQHLLDSLDTDVALHLAARIRALIAQRVSAETERWQNRDHQRLDQIERLQETVRSFQGARAERPNPDPLEQARQSGFEQGIAAAAEYVEARPNEQPAVLAGLMRDLGSMYAAERPAPEPKTTSGWVLVPIETTDAMRRAYWALIGENDDGPNPWAAWAAMIGSAPPSPAAAVDYTERARVVLERAYLKSKGRAENDGAKHGWSIDTVRTFEQQLRYNYLCDYVGAALSAVASERDAAAIRAFGERVWSDTEEVAYQAGVSDTRARLREPDVREAVAKACCGAYGDNYDEQPPDIETLRERRKREGGDGTVRAYDPGLPTQKDWLDVADAALTKIAEMLK